MLVQDLINLINLEADELLDEDTDNIPYINAAIDYLSFTLNGLHDPEMMAVIQVTDGLPVPTDFVDFIPHNGYPVYIQADTFYTNTGDTVKAQYAIAKPHVSTVADPIPFKDLYGSALTFIASFLIKKKSYIPVEYTGQDSTFVQAVLAAIAKAKGGS
jgi:hypothetical protein